MKVLIIDGSKFSNEISFYEYIEGLFPATKSYFGKNLDALFDILSENSYEEILVKDFQKIHFELGDEFFHAFLMILFDLGVEKRIIFEA